MVYNRYFAFEGDALVTNEIEVEQGMSFGSYNYYYHYNQNSIEYAEKTRYGASEHPEEYSLDQNGRIEEVSYLEVGFRYRWNYTYSDNGTIAGVAYYSNDNLDEAFEFY